MITFADSRWYKSTNGMRTAAGLPADGNAHLPHPYCLSSPIWIWNPNDYAYCMWQTWLSNISNFYGELLTTEAQAMYNQTAPLHILAIYKTVRSSGMRNDCFTLNLNTHNLQVYIYYVHRLLLSEKNVIELYRIAALHFNLDIRKSHSISQFSTTFLSHNTWYNPIHINQTIANNNMSLVHSS